MLVLDPQAASADVLSRLRFRHQGSIEGARATLDVAVIFRDGRIPFLWRTRASGTLRRGIGGRAQSASGGVVRPPQATQRVGGELPRELRQPSCACRRRDRANRRPRPRRDELLRGGHPLGPLKWLCPQRGARQRTRRPLLRGTWFSEDRARVFARRPILLPPLGCRRQGPATRSVISAPQGGG